MGRDLASVRRNVADALRILGIRNFLLGVHDAAFPGLEGEDLGCGTPYSDAAAQFLEFARELGFNGIQLGPQGMTSPGNPSPYDGTLFSRNPLLLAPLMLTRDPWDLIGRDKLAAIVAAGPHERTTVHRAFAEQACQKITSEVARRFRQRLLRGDTQAQTVREFWTIFRQRNAAWLRRDALYEVLRNAYGGEDWQQWQGGEEARLDRRLLAPAPGMEEAIRGRLKGLLRRHARVIEDYGFTQFLLLEQHQALRARCRSLGMTLFGDFQIGLSARDAWSAQAFLLPGYRLGAPPSRTNPAGQPWNYPVLDPCRYFQEDRNGRRRPGPAVRFLRERVDKLFAEFDGLRIDHPHGLICPWVYRAGEKDFYQAVQAGARLFASPDLADHPELAQFAIVRPDQIDRRAARHDDAWVKNLDVDQVRQYALLFAAIEESAASRPDGPRQAACEVLSTQPYPLRRVMDLYGRGRFRVTQKADLDDPRDVYRSENARSEDWLMLGNHDTPPIWTLADDWCATGAAQRQADYLAGRLRIPATERAAWIGRVAADPGLLVQAKFADLFIGPARNVMVYFTDLLGMRQAYNRPGTVSETNWSLRIDPDYRKRYRCGVECHCALNIPAALALALRAREPEEATEYRILIAELESAGCP